VFDLVERVRVVVMDVGDVMGLLLVLTLCMGYSVECSQSRIGMDNQQ
jgi:hypothetical protein